MAVHASPSPPFLREVGRAFPILVLVYASMAAGVGAVTSMLARRIMDKAQPLPAPSTDLTALVRDALVRTAVDASDAFLLFMLLLPVVAAISLIVIGVVVWAARALLLIVLPPRIAQETKGSS